MKTDAGQNVELYKKYGQDPTAAGIISGKNNEPTTVVMNHTFADVKDLQRFDCFGNREGNVINYYSV